MYVYEIFKFVRTDLIRFKVEFFITNLMCNKFAKFVSTYFEIC